MSFVSEFDALDIAGLVSHARTASPMAVNQTLARSALTLSDFAALLSPAASGRLEEMARRSQQLTQQRFGKVMRLFAPLYLSNECINNCTYCGFSRDNPILRVTLSLDDVRREALAIAEQGFRNILLVAGEHPKFVSNGYVAESIKVVREVAPSVSLEIGPLETSDYRSMVSAGADGLVVYQESYDRSVYAQMHTSGPKRDFNWRLETPERAYDAGFRRLGIGALYGLADWRWEAISLAAHALYLLRHCWKAYLTISFPRLRPCAGEFQPLTHLSDREMAQLVCAFRLLMPDAGLVLSTRESPALRDGLARIGITLMSAGSHTEPGGYTGAGSENLHQTKRGRIVAKADEEHPGGNGSAVAERKATEQFNIADPRSSHEVAERIRSWGYEPVWKDWDTALSE